MTQPWFLSRALPGLALLLLGSSCVPAGSARVALSSPTAFTSFSVPPAADPAASALPPEQAMAINDAIPFSTAPNPAAAPFFLAGENVLSRARALDCLAAAVYYEAASESEDGQRAVAQVVLNRVRNPAYPSTICGVVFEGSDQATGCQFTFTCDGSLARLPSRDGWARARRIAADALTGYVYAPVGEATHYHTRAVLPGWAGRLVKSAEIGAHIFYRLPGMWGTPTAFTQHYAGAEPPISLAVRQARAQAARIARPAAVLASWDPVPAVTAQADSPQPAASLSDSPPNHLPDSRIRDEWRNSGAIRAVPLPQPMASIH